MSIVDHFGKRKREPELASVPAPVARPAVPAVPHEKMAQSLALLGHLNDEAERLREDNQRLRNELNLSQMRTADLKLQLSDTSFNAEGYRQYAMEIHTHIQSAIDHLTRANEAAMKVHEINAKRPNSSAIDMVERETADIAAKFGADREKTEAMP